MGTLGGGNGDNWPPDGGETPDLPPEWGPIVVPDDLAELAEESAQVRRELQREARQRARARRFGWLTGRRGATAGRGDPAATALRMPILIMMVAIFATLTSLFIVAWPGQHRPVAIRPTEAARTVPARPAGTVPALDLLDARGQAVPIRGLLPAVILITDGCECSDLVAATAAAAPPEITVVAVAARTPKLTGAGLHSVRALADPAGELRSTLGLDLLAGAAAVLLVERDADIFRTVPAASSITTFRDDLVGLAAAN